MKTNIFGTEYEIDENAEQSDEDDHSVHHRDKSDTQSLHCLALRLIVALSAISWGNKLYIQNTLISCLGSRAP